MAGAELEASGFDGVVWIRHPELHQECFEGERKNVTHELLSHNLMVLREEEHAQWLKLCKVILP